MTSKHSFFKLLTEDFRRRLWAFALIIIGFLIAFPLWSFFVTDNIVKYQYRDNLSRYTESQMYIDFAHYYGADNPDFAIGLAAITIFAAATGLLWLYSPKKTDFFHSLPVRREERFSTIFINGLLQITVPYLLCALLSALIWQGKLGASGLLGLSVILFLKNMCRVILIYGLIGLVIVLTGNAFAGIVMAFIICFEGLLLFWGIASMIELHLYTMEIFSPLYNDYIMKTTPLFAGFAMTYHIYVTGIPVTTLVGMLIIGLISGFVSLLLYRIRPSEKSGKSIVFDAAKHIIYILVTFTIAIDAACFVTALNSDYSAAWEIIMLIVGFVLAHIGVKLFMELDIRSVLKIGIPTVISGSLTLLTLLMFKADPLELNTYIPDKEDIESMGIYEYMLNQDVSPMLSSYAINAVGSSRAWSLRFDYEPYYLLKNLRLTDIEAPYAIAEEGVRNAGKYPVKPFQYNNYAESDDKLDMISVSYHLKNGRDISRVYYLDREKISDKLSGIYDNPEYKRGMYRVYDIDEEKLSGATICTYAGYFGSASPKIKLSDAAIKELYEAYTKEFEGLTDEERHRESPVAEIQFMQKTLEDFLKEESSIKEQHYMDSFYIYPEMEMYDWYPIYPSFKETIAIAEKNGIDIMGVYETEGITKVEISKDYLLEDGKNEYWQEETAELMLEKMSEEDKKSFMDSLTMGTLDYVAVSFGSLADSESDYIVQIYREGSDREYSFHQSYAFKEGEVPDYVARYFGEKQSDFGKNNTSGYLSEKH